MGVNSHIGYTALDREKPMNVVASTRPKPSPAPPYYYARAGQTESIHADDNAQKQDIVGDAIAFGALFGL